MGLRVKNGHLEYRFLLGGQPVRVSTGLADTERNRKKAEQMEAVHRQAILEGRLGIRRLDVRSFKDAIAEYLAHEEVNRQEQASTLDRIKVSARSSKAFFDTAMVSVMTAGDVERYKIWRLKGDTENEIAPVRPVTCKHDLDNLSLFFQWACRMNYCRENIVDAVKKPSDRDAVREHLISAEEEKAYFTAALAVSSLLYDIARLILLQGCRPAEIFGLAQSDVDLDKGKLSVPKGKTRAARRTLRLTPEAKSILARRLAKPGRWVFPAPKASGLHIEATTLNHMHDRAATKAKVSCVLYDFRHTFATRMAQAGCDLPTLARILGHADIRVTQRYIHLSQQHVDEAMKKFAAQEPAKETAAIQ